MNSGQNREKAGFNSIVYEEEARFPRLFQASISDAVDAEPREISVPGYVTAFDVTPDGFQQECCKASPLRRSTIPTPH